MRTEVFPGRLEKLGEICDFVARAAKQAGLDETAVYAVELCVDEACTNIIEHAYGGEDRGVIECSCNQNKEGLTVVLHDHGRPFHPPTIHPRKLRTQLKHSKSGGAGLYLMHSLMDDVQFRFNPGEGNTLVMVKKKK